MTILHSTAKLVKDFRIDVDNGRSHAVCLDQPVEEDGTNMGPTALELALMGYAGCYATIFVLTAKRMRIELKDLEAKAEAVKTAEAGTITEVAFDIVIKSDARDDRLMRAHELTVKNCPVGKIFDKAGIKSSYKVAIKKE